ncbi:hypothetical protein DR950_17805 [Kitasatospora xanthocidica]|uniref:Uncharacterized protein n=1 Tax=Kitasatospora xanthocidica TaxID=83382 RepID=A0A372ZU49_9ACTN|nr:hypothetical protein DR950_17805 [Kitasatospora xanthocidica]
MDMGALLQEVERGPAPLRRQAVPRQRRCRAVYGPRGHSQGGTQMHPAQPGHQSSGGMPHSVQQ